MNVKALVAMLLGLFLMAAVAVIVYQGTSGGDVVPSVAPGSGDRVVAYYFHATSRCPTCKKIEQASIAVFEESFGDALADGSLVWAPVNIELPENKHYFVDFEMTTRTLVLAEVKGDETLRWQRLDKVWALSRDEDALREFIRRQTATFLAGTG